MVIGTLKHFEIYMVNTVVLTQVAIDEFAVVHLTPHGTDLFEFGFLILHSFPQPLEFVTLRHRLALTWVLLLQIPQSLLLKTERKWEERTGEGDGQLRNGKEHAALTDHQNNHATDQQKPFHTHLTTHNGELQGNGMKPIRKEQVK